MNKNVTNFKKQINEDINFISKNYVSLDPNLLKDEYAFNFWIQTKMYEVDEEVALNSITEYKDKGIDCFIHYEDTKELYLIQNKYYDEKTVLSEKEVSHFLTTSLAALEKGNYKSQELQYIYNTAKSDSNYKIWLHFYITNNKISEDITNIINEFNKGSRPVLCEVRAKLFSLDDIYELYYGVAFDKKIKFEYKIRTTNKGTLLKIMPEQYNLPGMSEAYYIMTPIKTLYNMYIETKKINYPLFEENIREYMGKSPINSGIIQTLKDENERKNFFYYNNGITIICDSTGKGGSGNIINLIQPQIVNGCQTVSTIYEVLNSYNEKEIEKLFDGVYVMTKILIQTNKSPNFYKKVVKYTNSQNSINEKAFSSSTDYFLRIQEHFYEKGFLLLVKPSDKHKFSQLSNVESNKLLSKAKQALYNIDLDIKKISDIQIPLDKVLQVLLSFVRDGHSAFTKKNLVLKQNSEIYDSISTKIEDYLTIDNIIYLYLLYRKAENDKKNSSDNRTPIPYYVISFISFFIENKNFDILQKVINILKEKNSIEFTNIYSFFKDLTNQYKIESKNKNDLEYNGMIKTRIDRKLLEDQVELLSRFEPYKDGKSFIDNISELENRLL